MSELNLIMGDVNSSISNHKNYLNLLRNQKLAKNEKSFYPIFLLSPPRTSATFIYQALIKKFNKKFIVTGQHFYKFNSALLEKKKLLNFVVTNNSISHSHAGAEKINLNLLKTSLDKIIINLRDPRQSLVSLIRHRMLTWSKDPFSFFETSDCRSPEYINYGFIKKVLFEIDTNGFFSDLINYINGWLLAEKDKEFSTKILFSLQEELKENPVTFFNSLLKFYDIDEKYFFTGKEHYLSTKELAGRAGPLDEWRKILPTEIIQEMNKKMPEFTRKSWKTWEAFQPKIEDYFE